LRSGVSWTGIVTSNVDTVPLYNERTQEIVWNIDRISATTGVISDPIEAVFQIEAVPNITEVGQYKQLVSGSTFEAKDEFTDFKITGSDAALTTALTDDPTISLGGGQVAL